MVDDRLVQQAVQKLQQEAVADSGAHDQEFHHYQSPQGAAQSHSGESHCTQRRVVVVLVAGRHLPYFVVVQDAKASSGGCAQSQRPIAGGEDWQRVLWVVQNPHDVAPVNQSWALLRAMAVE